VPFNAMLVQQVASVRCIKQSAPLWEGWYRTALSWRCLSGVPYIMQQTPHWRNCHEGAASL